MKMLGIVAVFGGMLVLALNIFGFVSTPPYAAWVPIGLGLLMMIADRG